MTNDVISTSEAPETKGGLREALIDAALTMVKDEGIEAISVREVARRAGVSSGAPFRHFKDRNALLAAVAEDGFLRLEAWMERTTAAAPDDVVEHLKAVGVTYASFAARHPAHFRVMHHPALALDTYPRIAAIAQRRREYLRGLIVEGQRQGLIRNADTELVLLLCVSAVNGLARMFVDGGAECPVDLTCQPFEEVDVLARAVVELAGIGIVDDSAREKYQKSLPLAVRGKARKKEPAPKKEAAPKAKAKKPAATKTTASPKPRSASRAK